MKKAMNPVIKSDIMRYKKNKLGSSLALLSIVGNCFYFMFLYAEVKNGNFFYNWMIAFDVIYNLFFMLAAFLISEQIKNYNRTLFPLQVILAAAQVGRIFWLPFLGLRGGIISGGKFTLYLVFLAISAAALLASALIGFFKAVEIESFNKKIESGEIKIEDTLKKLDEEEALEAKAEPAEANGEVQ